MSSAGSQEPQVLDTRAQSITVGNHGEDIAKNGALHRAAQYGSVELVSLLQRSGWNVNAFWPNEDSNVTGIQGNYTTPLSRAVAGGNSDMVRLLLENGALPDNKRSQATTPLQDAVRCGLARAVEYLLQHGANGRAFMRNDFQGDECEDVNEDASCSDHESLSEDESEDENEDRSRLNIREWVQPIHVAALKGYSYIITLLLRHGAHVLDATRRGSTALHCAATGGQLHLVKFLLEHESVEIDMRGYESRTPLHNACLGGHSHVVRYLIDKGADLHIKTRRGMTPLLCLIKSVSVDMELMEYLIQRSASVQDTANNGVTALHLAAENANINVMRLVHENGVDINARDSKGLTPLHCAARKSCEHVEYLSQNGADLLAESISGTQPIHTAIRWSCDLTVLLHLIENSPNPSIINCADHDGNTPLHFAAQTGDLKKVCLLLLEGADINSENRRHHTPLYIAAVNEKVHVAKILIRQGAAVDGIRSSITGPDSTDYPLTPLRISLSNLGPENLEITANLIANGADLSRRSRYGMTYLHYAVEYDNEKAANLLLQNGCDVNEIIDRGYTALFTAVEANKRSFVALLLKNGANPSSVSYHFDMPLHLAARRRTETEISWMLLKAAGLPWLEPSNRTSYPRSFPPNWEASMRERETLFSSEIVEAQSGPHEIIEESQARSLAASIWQKLKWRHWRRGENYPSYHGKLHTLWENSVYELKDSYDLLVDQLPGGLLLYLRLIIEMGAAWNCDYDPDGTHSARFCQNILENLALVCTLDNYQHLSSDDLWSLLRQSAKDAQMRVILEPGRYFGRWRRLMTDILRTRNCTTRVRRALSQLPSEINTLVLHEVLRLEDLPRENDWKQIWLTEAEAKNSLESSTEGLLSLCDATMRDLYLTGGMMFDQVSRRFAWILQAFGGACYYGFEPTFLYDGFQKRWVVNQAHVDWYGQLLYREDIIAFDVHI